MFTLGCGVMSYLAGQGLLKGTMCPKTLYLDLSPDPFVGHFPQRGGQPLVAVTKKLATVKVCEPGFKLEPNP